MDLSPSTTPAVRHDGWTDARKAQFLEALAVAGTVRAACARAGLSREAAYQLRRRDEVFARAWAAALVLAHENACDVLASRALDGIEEDVWHRGEVVGTKTRFDTRLLLAHLARLDKLVAAGGAALADAARFDELVALACGAEPPAQIECGADGLPLPRAQLVELAGAIAEAEAADAALDPGAPTGEEREVADILAWRAARAEAGREHDAWCEAAHARVDRLLAGAAAPAETGAAGTVSGVSSSAPLEGMIDPRGGRSFARA